MLKLLPLSLCLVLSIPLHAQEKRTYSGKLIVADSSEATYSNSSESHRQSLQWGLGLSGLANRTRYSLFYYLNPDLALEVFSRQLGDPVEDEKMGDWERSEKSFGVAAQYFMKDAWNVRLGLLSRQTVLTNDYFNRDNASDTWHNTFDLIVRQRDIAAEVAIGTQWQWSSFYCGFDWLNYEYRIYKASSSAAMRVKDASRVRMNYAESKVEEARVADNDLNKSNIYVSARLGWSF